LAACSTNTGQIGSTGFQLQRNEAADTTILVGPVTDQARLRGVLSRLFDLGLPLLSVRTVDQE